MALLASFTTVRPEMARTRTYLDFSKFLGEKPKRLGIVSKMYENLTASYLTEGLGNIMYNKQKSGSKFQKINSLMFEWEIDVNFVKRIPFAATVADSGANGSDITVYFPERYYEKYDTFQVVGNKQQLIVLQAPVRKADTYWEYICQLIDDTGDETLDTNYCQAGMETRFLTNIQPEFSEEGYTKFQSNIEKHRNWITEHRVDISQSSRYARMEDTFVKIANGEAGGDYKEVIFRMPKINQVLLESFMTARNNSLLFGKSTMNVDGKCTVHDPHTNRPLIAGDGAIPQINRFAGMYSYSKLNVGVFNKAIMTMSQKSANPTGNEYIFIVNERLYADILVVLALHLMQFKPVDAKVYSQEAGNKLKVGAEYVAYNFLGNQIIFKVDRALSIEYPDKGYGVLIDLTADKTTGAAAILMFTLEGAEFISNTVAGVGGLNGGQSGPVASPVAGSRFVNSGYAGIGVFSPYRSYILMEN